MQNVLLPAVARFDEASISQLRSALEASKRPNGDQLSEAAWRRWRTAPNQVVLYTLYADCIDVKLPIQMRYVIEQENGNVHEFPFKITLCALGIGSLLLPVPGLSKGHKHVCICTFTHGTPPILNRLPPVTRWTSAGYTLLLSD